MIAAMRMSPTVRRSIGGRSAGLVSIGHQNIVIARADMVALFNAFASQISVLVNSARVEMNGSTHNT